MAQSTPITIIGNLGSDPELRFTPQGIAVANLSVAVTPRVLNNATNEWEDGDPAWYQCTVWREMAENVAESLQRGDRVIVNGDLIQRNWEDNDGNKRSSITINVNELGHTLRFGTTKYTRVSKEQPARKTTQRSGSRR